LVYIYRLGYILMNKREAEKESEPPSESWSSKAVQVWRRFMVIAGLSDRSLNPPKVALYIVISWLLISASGRASELHIGLRNVEDGKLRE